MKKVIIISMLVFLVLGLMAQTEADLKKQESYDKTKVILEEVQEEIDEAMEDIRENTGLDLQINVLDSESDSAYMGVFHSELDLGKMQELKYDKLYGVLITGVAENSAADFFRLAKDDIIIQIDDYQIINSKDFSKKLKLFRSGDKVKLKIFRFGEEKTIDFVFSSRNKIIRKEGEEFVFVEKSDTKTKKDKKGKFSAGTGGGSWLPVWFMSDFEDVNIMLAQNGLAEINELELGNYSGIIMHGGGGKGNVGKGWMLGGMGAEYNFEKSAKLADSEDIRKVYYEIGYGGVTLDKRFALTRKFIVGAGFMLGGGHQSIKLSQTDGNFDWQFTDTTSFSNSNIVTMKRDYFLFQPKAVAMYRILDWLAIRAEGGYMMSHARNSGWQANFAGAEYSIEGSPNTSLDGFTFTIGPWLGF